MDSFAKVGLIGLAIVGVLNAIALWVLHKPSASPSSIEWWTQWFPIISVWLLFLALSAVRALRSQGSDDDPKS